MLLLSSTSFVMGGMLYVEILVYMLLMFGEQNFRSVQLVQLSSFFVTGFHVILPSTTRFIILTKTLYAFLVSPM